MSPLLEQQFEFSVLSAAFILWAKDQGYRVTYGETWRSPEEAMIHAQNHTGIANSLHLLRLAIDLNAWKDDKELLTKEDYQPLGDYWKTLGPLCCWGGDFSKPDSDHFSMTWHGVK